MLSLVSKLFVKKVPGRRTPWGRHYGGGGNRPQGLKMYLRPVNRFVLAKMFIGVQNPCHKSYRT